MNASVRCGALLASIFLTACSHQPLPLPAAPTPTVVQIPAPVVNADDIRRNFPEVSRPARVYVEATPLYLQFGGVSRYVLYDDATFSFQYSSVAWGFGESGGSYKEANDAILFFWGNSAARSVGDAAETKGSLS